MLAIPVLAIPVLAIRMLAAADAVWPGTLATNM
jgi:hypothetical protein